MTRVNIGLGGWLGGKLSRRGCDRLGHGRSSGWAGSSWIGEGRDCGVTSGSCSWCSSRCHKCFPKFYQSSPRFIVVPEKELDVSGEDATQVRWNGEVRVKTGSKGFKEGVIIELIILSCIRGRILEMDVGCSV